MSTELILELILLALLCVVMYLWHSTIKDNNELLEGLGELNEDNKELKAQIAQLRSKKSNADLANAVSTSTIRELQKQIEGLQIENRDLRAQIAALQDRITDLQKERTEISEGELRDLVREKLENTF